MVPGMGTERDRAGNRRRLGVIRASLGSLSESVAIFDPAPLKEIAAELGHSIRSRPDRRFDAVGQRITAVDGTVIETVKRVAELSWRPKAKGKHLSAYRLHTHVEVLSGKAARIDASSARGVRCCAVGGLRDLAAREEGGQGLPLPLSRRI
jgi:hypothetical protein